jgi:hypothetical protein
MGLDGKTAATVGCCKWSGMMKESRRVNSGWFIGTREIDSSAEIHSRQRGS